jgi:hypothetical protein
MRRTVRFSRSDRSGSSRRTAEPGTKGRAIPNLSADDSIRHPVAPERVRQASLSLASLALRKSLPQLLATREIDGVRSSATWPRIASRRRPRRSVVGAAEERLAGSSERPDLDPLDFVVWTGRIRKQIQSERRQPGDLLADERVQVRQQRLCTVEVAPFGNLKSVCDIPSESVGSGNRLTWVPSSSRSCRAHGSRRPRATTPPR